MKNITGTLYEFLLEPMLHGWKKRVANWIAESPGTTLDICCGTGKQCRLIAEHSYVIGLDIDLTMLKFAKSLAPTLSFVCADAGLLPFKNGAFLNAGISLALHDKPEALRTRIIEEARVSLQPDGYFYIIDFEQPYSLKSRIGYAFIYIIELMAGWDHFSNGRKFVKAGGQTFFQKHHSLTPIKTHASHWGCSSLSMNRFSG